MGWQTIAMMGLQGLQAGAQQKAARGEANAIVQQGALDAQNKARETKLRGASQTVSFLNSGLTLEGTPENAIAGTYETGLADVNQIVSNANTKSKNVYSAARAKSLESFASGAAGLGLGGLDLGSTAFGRNVMNPIGQEFDSLFDSSPVGPYRSPF